MNPFILLLASISNILDLNIGGLIHKVFTYVNAKKTTKKSSQQFELSPLFKYAMTMNKFFICLNAVFRKKIMKPSE